MLDDLAKKAKDVLPDAGDKVVDALQNAAENVDVDAVGEKIKDVVPGDKENEAVDKITEMLGGDGDPNTK